MSGLAETLMPARNAAPGLYLARLWRTTIRAIGQALPLQGDATDIDSVLDEQSRTLAVTALLFASLGINSVGLILIDFGRQIGLYGAFLIVTIATLYVIWVVLSLPRYRIRQRKLFMRSSLSILVTQGVLWGFLINQLAAIATDQQRNLVTAIIMGLVSAPMLGAPFSAAMAFWIPTVLATGVAVAFTLQPFDVYLLLCFSGYLAFTFAGIVVINRTLLERSIGRVRLQQQNETIGLFLRDYEDNAADWLWETDSRLRLLKVPARLAQLLGYSREALEGGRLDQLLGLDGSEHRSARELAAILAARAAFRDLTVQLDVNGQTRWWCLTGRPLLDARGRFQGYRGIGSDATDVRLAEQKIRDLATFDSLTGLYNRRLFLETMERECSRDRDPASTCPVFGLLLLDLDHFKGVNDDFGHATGDQLLVVASERLRGAVRQSDLLARLGGDEFAILVPSNTVADALEVAERLIDTMSRPFQLGETRVTIGASAGIALFPQDGQTPNELLRCVDLALYTAKGHGRGNFQRFKPWMSEVYQDKLMLQSDLRVAIEQGQLRVEYQPIFNLRTGAVVSVEALARWDHPLRGAVQPSEFIPLAEEIGLIAKVGEFVLDQACRTANGWHPRVRVAVNLSPMQFSNKSLLKTVSHALSQSGLAPERLELELTESTWLEATRPTLDQLDDLGRLGVRTVLDDFGTGYSSLACLREFRFQGLKIDASFIRDLGRDEKAAAIIRTIATLAADIGVTLTAEGVETAEQMALLVACGIEQAQGFFLRQPQPQADITAAIRLGVVATDAGLLRTDA